MEKNLRRAMLSCAGCTLMLFVTCGTGLQRLFGGAAVRPGPERLYQHADLAHYDDPLGGVSARHVRHRRYYRRFGYRTGCALAAMLACVSFLLFAAAKSLAAYYFAGAVAGVSYALGSMVPASILMRRWFRAHSGLAIGICSAGTGLATVVFSPLFTAIAESGGVDRAFLWTAAFCAAAAVLVFFLIRSDLPRLASSRGEQLFRRVRRSARCTPCIRPGCAGRCFCWPFCWSAASARRALPI